MSEKLTSVVKPKAEVEIAGVKYTVEPLTLGDLADFEAYITQRKRASLIETAIEFGMSKREAISVAVSNTNIDLDAEMSTPTGISRLLWQSLSKQNDGLDYETFVKSVTPEMCDMLAATILGQGSDDSDEVAGN